jgi:iron(III) transport system permease protein
MLVDRLFFWRVWVAAGLLLVVGLPLILPFGQLIGQPTAWESWQEIGRILHLLTNTACLIAGAVALAVPLGTALAILLYRTDLPGRRLLRFFNILLLFVPLPLTATAWQAALGAGGLLPLGSWVAPLPGDPDLSASAAVWKPWVHGLGAAIFVHAAAGLPWVVWIVGQGLSWVERDLEEDALTVVGPLQVIWNVTLPRCKTAIWAAALWISLQVAGEITVTDVMQVNTFAEEVYTQIVVGDDLSVARSVAVAAPTVAVAGAILVLTVPRLERRIPPLESLCGSAVTFRLSSLRSLCAILVPAGTALFVWIPLASLSWKAGLHGSPQSWSAAVASSHLARTLQLRGGTVAAGLATALGTGLAASGLALLAAWLAQRSRWFVALMIGLAALAWAEPAPIVGLGLKGVIGRLIDLFHSDTLARLLYFGPSMVPVFWAHLIRFFPYAVALLWPVVPQIPAELRDGIRVDGARPWQEFRHLIFPLALPFAAQATLAVAILSLGELGAEKLVETPDSQTVAHAIFDLMHYGVTNDLAALSLILLGMVALGGLTLALMDRLLAIDRPR